MLFCRLAYVGQIVSRNIMLNLSVLWVVWRMFFFFPVLDLGMVQKNSAPKKIVYIWQIEANGIYQ